MDISQFDFDNYQEWMDTQMASKAYNEMRGAGLEASGAIGKASDIVGGEGSGPPGNKLMEVLAAISAAKPYVSVGGVSASAGGGGGGGAGGGGGMNTQMLMLLKMLMESQKRQRKQPRSRGPSDPYSSGVQNADGTA